MAASAPFPAMRTTTPLSSPNQKRSAWSHNMARMMGRDEGMPTGSLLTALMFAGKDTSAQVCPVFALRLRSSGGRKIADTFKGLMQGWDDQK